MKLYTTAGFDPNTDSFYPLYEAIEKRGVPVLVHTGQTNIKLLSDNCLAQGEHIARMSTYMRQIGSGVL